MDEASGKAPQDSDKNPPTKERAPSASEADAQTSSSSSASDEHETLDELSAENDAVPVGDVPSGVPPAADTSQAATASSSHDDAEPVSGVESGVAPASGVESGVAPASGVESSVAPASGVESATAPSGAAPAAGEPPGQAPSGSRRGTRKPLTLDPGKPQPLEKALDTGTPPPMPGSKPARERKSTLQGMPSPLSKSQPKTETQPRGTSPELVLARVRSQGTATGLGVVHGVPVPLIGRRDELDLLKDAFKSAGREDEAHAVSILGPAGVGKSRLVIELIETLQASDYEFVLMTCFAGSPSADSQQDVLQRLLVSRLQLPGPENPVGDRLQALNARVREIFSADDVDWATHVLSAFYELPAPAMMLREVQALRTDRAALRLATRELVERLVRHEAKERPVLLWFDDLEYDDAEGLIELSELLVKLNDSAVLALMIGEGAEMLPSERLAIGGVHHESMTLGPLPPSDSEELVRDILRFVDPIPEQLVSMVVQTAQGVPLAIEQLIRLLIDHGVVEPGEYEWSVHLDKLMETDALPSTVEELARVRIEALPEDRRNVLEVAAMLGTSFGFDDLVRILRLEPMDYDEVPWFSDARATWTRDVLLDLMGREIIALHDQDDEDLEGEVFEFRFPSEQQFLLEQADVEQRRTVHGCFARLLSERSGDPVRVAQHLEAAGLFKEAARAWLEVGENAERAYFNHSALDALTHALEFLGPEDGIEYMQVLDSVGRVARRVGQYDIAEAALTTSIHTSFAYEDRRRAIRAYRGLGAAQLSAGFYVAAETSFRRALDLSEQDEREHAVAASLDGIARAMIEVGEPGAFAEGIKILERALEIRRSVGNPKGTANTLDMIGLVCLGRGDLNRSLACYTESVNARRAVDDWSGLARTLSWMAWTCHRLGRDEIARRHAEEALEVSERTGELSARLFALVTLAEFALDGRRLDEAGEWLASALALMEQLSERPAQILCLLTRARWRALNGDVQGAFEDASLAVEAANEGDSQRQLGVALRELAECQAAMIRARIKPRPSVTQTRDRFLEAQRLLEDMGNWHELARTLRAYGEFLLERGKEAESKRCMKRADALDPLTKHD